MEINMEKGEIKNSLTNDGIFRFLLPILSVKNPVKILEKKEVSITYTGRIVLDKVLKEPIAKKASVVKVCVLPLEKISCISTKCTTGDVLRDAKRLKLSAPTFDFIFSIFEKFDANSLVEDMGFDELVFLTEPIEVEGHYCVPSIRFHFDKRFYRASLDVAHFSLNRNWEGKIGFVFSKESFDED